MGRQAPGGLLGIHMNLLALAIGLKDQLPAESEQEHAAHDAVNTFTTDGFGYFLEQSTRPQTIGYSLRWPCSPMCACPRSARRSRGRRPTGTTGWSSPESTRGSSRSSTTST